MELWIAKKLPWKSSNFVSSMILDDHFSVKIAILSSNLNDFDQPDMSNRFKGAEEQFRCINRTLLRMRVSISKFSIFKIFIFPLRNQKRSSNLFLTFRYASFFLSNLLGVYSTKCQNLMSESSVNV